MLSKPLIGLIVADTLVMLAFFLMFVFHALPPMQLVYVLIPVTVIVDGVFIVWLLRSRRRVGEAERSDDSSAVRPR
jgi:hypothetical protein